MADALPAHYAMSFTPTIHANIPTNIDPTKTKLPRPFIVVVTGAGKGLGYHISLAYAKAGCSGISISSRTQSDLDKLTKEILAIDSRIEVLSTVCDTQDDSSIQYLEQQVRSKWSRVDVVIANAGIISKYVDPAQRDSNRNSTSNLPIGIAEDSDWARVLDINLLGVWRTAKAFTPLLRETRDGPQTLICSTSLAAHSTNSYMTPIAYNVSKIACNRLIEHVDNDHREKDGIHAYALHPGAVLTPQTQGHQTEDGMWGKLLSDDEGLAGAMCVWLGKEKKGWLSGRYVSCNWDVEELEGMKDAITSEDKLKFRMVV